jgi:hypothetical protein
MHSVRWFKYYHGYKSALIACLTFIECNCEPQTLDIISGLDKWKKWLKNQNIKED